jgi:hypothetical protein
MVDSGATIHSVNDKALLKKLRSVKVIATGANGSFRTSQAGVLIGSARCAVGRQQGWHFPTATQLERMLT